MKRHSSKVVFKRLLKNLFLNFLEKRVENIFQEMPTVSSFLEKRLQISNPCFHKVILVSSQISPCQFLFISSRVVILGFSSYKFLSNSLSLIFLSAQFFARDWTQALQESSAAHHIPLQLGCPTSIIYLIQLLPFPFAQARKPIMRPISPTWRLLLFQDFFLFLLYF